MSLFFIPRRERVRWVARRFGLSFALSLCVPSAGLASFADTASAATSPTVLFRWQAVPDAKVYHVKVDLDGRESRLRTRHPWIRLERTAVIEVFACDERGVALAGLPPSRHETGQTPSDELVPYTWVRQAQDAFYDLQLDLAGRLIHARTSDNTALLSRHTQVEVLAKDEYGRLLDRRRAQPDNPRPPEPALPAPEPTPAEQRPIEPEPELVTPHTPVASADDTEPATSWFMTAGTAVGLGKEVMEASAKANRFKAKSQVLSGDHHIMLAQEAEAKRSFGSLYAFTLRLHLHSFAAVVNEEHIEEASGLPVAEKKVYILPRHGATASAWFVAWESRRFSSHLGLGVRYGASPYMKAHATQSQDAVPASRYGWGPELGAGLGARLDDHFGLQLTAHFQALGLGSMQVSRWEAAAQLRYEVSPWFFLVSGLSLASESAKYADSSAKVSRTTGHLGATLKIF